MSMLVQIWAAALGMVLLFFVAKAIRSKRAAIVANDFGFETWGFFKKDALDIIVGVVAMSAILLFGNKLSEIPVLVGVIPNIKITDPITAGIAGWGMASIGVNIILARLGLGDKTKKENQQIVDYKTNIADQEKK